MAGGRRILSGCTSVWQGFAGRIPDSGPPLSSSLFLSPCKSKEELSHSAPWELRPGIQQLIFVCSVSGLCCVQALSQAVEWNRNQRNFFFLSCSFGTTVRNVQLSTRQMFFSCHLPTRSSFLVQAYIVFQNLIWISLPTHIWFWPVLPFPAL